MVIRPHRLCLIVVSVALLWVACGDDEIEQSPTISGGTPKLDTRTDTSDADAGRTIIVDARCDGLQPGARCDLPHASGVCVSGQCQFLSCESGFRDCDADTDNGCEADVTTADQCGACGVACTAPQSCQRGRAGWVCSVSSVCPDQRYDLDGDLENGCEWAAEWGEDGTFDPVSMKPDIAAELSTGAFAAAGRTMDARLVSSTDATSTTATRPAEPIATDFDDATTAHDIEELRGPNDTSLVAVGWTDAVTLSLASGSTSDDGVFRFVCEQISRRFRAIAGTGTSSIFAATAREVLQIDRGEACAPDAAAASADRQLCDTPSAVFGMRDYVEAYATSFDSTTCNSCLPDTDICPAFRPIGLEYLEQSASLVVFTKRGFFLLETSQSGFVPGVRLETTEVDETEQGATHYVAGTAVEDNGVIRVYLLTSDGTLRRFVVDATVQPAGPDIRLLLSANDPARLVPGADGALLIYDARNVWLLQPLGRSARIELLSEPNVFLGDGRTVYGAGYASDPSDEFSLLYFGVGRYYLRHVSR
jgi:hypothetical protein